MYIAIVRSIKPTQILLCQYATGEQRICNAVTLCLRPVRPGLSESRRPDRACKYGCATVEMMALNTPQGVMAYTRTLQIRADRLPMLTLPCDLLVLSAFLEHMHHVFEVPHILKRIPIDDDNVGKFSRIYGPEFG
jgi:hypothetical protein